MPKGFIKKINFIGKKVGVERRQELLEDIAQDSGFLPKGVSYEDMDETFVEFVNKELKVVIDGEEVPVIFLTIQRWAEFSRTWNFSDKYKDIKIPFITIVRQPNPQVGTNQAGLYNIPAHMRYTYIKVPTFKGGRRGIDLYKIPQPVSVDLVYEIRLFCNKMRDLNKLNTKVQKLFQSIQFYIWPNNHPMPLTLESIGDESNIDDFENRRFYVQPFELKLAGYIQDEDDFEITPMLNRGVLTMEVSDDVKTKSEFNIIKNGNNLLYEFVFKVGASNTFTFTTNYDIDITSLLNIENISNIQIIVDDVVLFNGLSIAPNVVIPILVNKKVKVVITKIGPFIGKMMMIANIN